MPPLPQRRPSLFIKFISISIFIVIALLYEFLFPPGAMAAIKSGQLINPITDVAWHEIFPIKIAGITIAGASGNYDTPDPAEDQPGSPPPGSVEAEVSPGPPTFEEALRKEKENKE